MVKFIMELVRNRSFILTTGTGPKKQVKTSKKRCPPGIDIDTTPLQRLYVPPSYHHLEEVCICRRSSNYALRKGLEGVRESSIPRHGNSVDVSQKMEAKTQYNQKSVSCFPP